MRQVAAIANLQAALCFIGAIFLAYGLDLHWAAGVGIALIAHALSPVVYHP